MAATAQRYGGAASQAESRPLRVNNFEIALDSNRAIAVNSNLGCRHFFSSRESMHSSAGQEQAEMKRSPRSADSFRYRRVPARLILRNGGIHLVRPRQDAALHVKNFA